MYLETRREGRLRFSTPTFFGVDELLDQLWQLYESQEGDGKDVNACIIIAVLVIASAMFLIIFFYI